MSRNGRLEQRPGPKCALGRVKFEFPNRFQVYLHDTPTRSTFTRTQRSVSHGCVRLERALDLARRLLTGAPDWPQGRIDKVLDTRKTTWAKLAQPMPVYLLYFTTFPDDQGQVAFCDDVYGWDAELLKLLDTAVPSASSRA